MPSANYVPIWVKEGLLLETRPDQMENFKNIDRRWVDVPWDPGRHYTVPWQWGTTGIGVNTAGLRRRHQHLGHLPRSAGRTGRQDQCRAGNERRACFAAIRYFGGEWCTDDKELLKKVRDKLVEAKPKWLSMDYGVDREVRQPATSPPSYYWNGASCARACRTRTSVYGYPKEGYPIFMDSVAVLKDAKNVENAKLFQNFIMDPENAAMISAFAKYANGIKGSEAFMPEDMKDAPEVNIPAEFAGKGTVHADLRRPRCRQLYTKIWTELQK